MRYNVENNLKCKKKKIIIRIVYMYTWNTFSKQRNENSMKTNANVLQSEPYLLPSLLRPRLRTPSGFIVCFLILQIVNTRNGWEEQNKKTTYMQGCTKYFFSRQVH